VPVLEWTCGEIEALRWQREFPFVMLQKKLRDGSLSDMSLADHRQALKQVELRISQLTASL